MSVNKVILIGNVGRDPEVRYLENGTATCTIPVATSETYLNKAGERVTTTEWHNVVLWRSLADFASKYVKKGSQVYVEGRIRSRSYDDKDGIKRYVTEVVALSLQLLGRKSDESVQSTTSSTSNMVDEKGNSPIDEPYPETEISDDLPF